MIPVFEKWISYSGKNESITELIVAMFLFLDMLYLQSATILSITVGVLTLLYKRSSSKWGEWSSLFLVLLLFNMVMIASCFRTSYLGDVLFFDILKCINYQIYTFIIFSLAPRASNLANITRLFKKIAVPVGGGLALIGVIKACLYQFELLPFANYFSANSSLRADYNVFGLMLLVCFIAFLTDMKWRSKYTFRNVIYFNSLLLCIILSASRRSNYLMYLLLIVYLLFYCSQNKISKSVELAKAFFLYCLPSLFFMTVVSLPVNSFFKQTTQQSSLEKIVRRASKVRYSSHRVMYGSYQARTERISYAKSLFDDYSFAEVIFGEGFNYLEKFSKKFNTENREDYPHQLFVSHLLYSGGSGLTLLLLTLLGALYSCWRNLNNLSFLTTCGFIYFMSSMVSGNSIYSHALIFPVIAISLAAENHRRVLIQKSLLLGG